MSSAKHGGGKGRRAQHHEEEEHENHERWLVSFADMMTLLTAVFIVLFSISQVDSQKFLELATGLSRGFGSPTSILDQGSMTPEQNILEGADSAIQFTADTAPTDQPDQAQVDAAAARAAADRSAQVSAEALATYEQLKAAQAAIEAALAAAGQTGAAQFAIDERGLVVHVVADQVLFGAEEATLREEGQHVLDALAPTLAALPNQLRIEGHTNSLPVTPGGPWPSNWELSAYRATTVLRYLVDADGLVPTRMSAAGYADTRPLLPVTDPASVSVNRRVDVVLLSDASAEANAQLPGLAAEEARSGVAPTAPATTATTTETSTDAVVSNEEGHP